MKKLAREICARCGKERPIDPRKHLCHECWQDDKDAEREAYYESHFGQTPERRHYGTISDSTDRKSL